MTRILVAEPLPLFRVGVRNLLERTKGFEVLAAASLDGALTAAERQPDIALVDLDLPSRGGVEAVRRLAGECEARCVVWSFAPAGATVLAAIRAGAVGYLRKDVSRAGLVRALRGIAAGEAPLPRDLTASMIDALRDCDAEARAREKAQVLSLREQEVLELVARGARNRSIASALAISEFTVKRHMQNILEKLELPSRTAAAAFYREAFGGAPRFELATSQTA